MSNALENFERLLAQGKNNALLRYSLGNEYHKVGRNEEALIHLQAAVAQDPSYSAAWKLLGKLLTESGQVNAALLAYQQGISAAETRGDIQAAKEMRVFARRLEKQLAGG